MLNCLKAWAKLRVEIYFIFVISYDYQYINEIESFIPLQRKICHLNRVPSLHIEQDRMYGCEITLKWKFNTEKMSV